MRKSTIASLLILCGSTAALANVAAPGGQTTNNTIMSNDMTTDSAPVPANDTMAPSQPMPADNAVMTNEMSPRPKPM